MRISYLSQDRPDLKLGEMQVCCAVANPSATDEERVKRIEGYPVGKPRAECLFHWQQCGELVESTPRQRDWEFRAWRRAWALHCGLKLHLDCHSDDELGQPQGSGQGRTRRHAERVDTRSLQIKRFVTKKVGTSVNPADLMTKPMPRSKIEQLMNITGHEFVGQSSRQQELCGMRLVGGLTDVKEKAKSLAAATAK